MLTGYGPHTDREWFLAKDLPAVLAVDKCRRYCRRTRREYEAGAYPRYINKVHVRFTQAGLDRVRTLV